MNNERYKRQLLLEKDYDFDQTKLTNATVFIAGAGGLGSPAAFYLAAAGIGRLIICDKDRIELSNLNRQIMHTTSRIGIYKTESAKLQLSDLNPDIDINTFERELTADNAAELIGDADLIIDCLDNINARYALNDYSIRTGIPIIHGGINGFAGQISFLNPPHTPCIRCIFPEAIENPAPIPVIGAVAGIIGSMQAIEAIKYLSKSGDLLRGTLRIFDGFTNEIDDLRIEKNPACPACSQI